MMVSAFEGYIGKDAPMQRRVELDLDKMAQWGVKFIHVWKLLRSNELQSRAEDSNIKAIIKLTDLSGSSSLTKSKLRGNNWFKDGAVLFYYNDPRDTPSHHKDLYM